MRNVLGRAGLAAVRAQAQRRLLLAFDFDGTLSPIVRDPDAATMRQRTAALLAEAANLYPCVVVSGRARADVAAKVARVPLRAVVGNHGMEPWAGLGAARRRAARWRTRLAAELPPIPGMVIEDKGPSLAIHYRRARARAEVRRLLLEVTSDLPGARVLEGKMVVNLLPAGAPDKGTAVLGLAKRLRCAAILYVGDDDNDEDAFALSQRAPVLGIRVGRARRSRAQWFLPSQTAVDRLLALLVRLRRR
jgi:trehalose 6-phosphate phosphatase